MFDFVVIFLEQIKLSCKKRLFHFSCYTNYCCA